MDVTHSDVSFEILGVKEKQIYQFCRVVRKILPTEWKDLRLKGFLRDPALGERWMTLAVNRERVIVMVMSIPADMLLSPK